MTFYKLSNTQINEAANEEEAVAYIGLKMIFDRSAVFENKARKEEVIANFNIANLFYDVSGKFTLNRSDKDKLTKGINGLIAANVVSLIDCDEKGNYVLNIADLFIERDTFAMMTQEEIRSIFNIKHKQHYNLLRFAAGLFSSINNSPQCEQYKCGFCSFNSMIERTGIECEKTCRNYFKILEDNGIIYVRHAETAKRDQNGQIKNLSNTYGRPQDKKEIDAYHSVRVGREVHDFTKHVSSAKRGQITRAYNKFVNGKYDEDIIALIKDCIAYNSQPGYDQNPEWCKDLTVFSQDDIDKAHAELNEEARERKEARQKSKQSNEGENKSKSTNQNQVELTGYWASKVEEFKKVNKHIQELKEREKWEEENRALTDEEYNEEYYRQCGNYY